MKLAHQTTLFAASFRFRVVLRLRRIDMTRKSRFYSVNEVYRYPIWLHLVRLGCFRCERRRGTQGPRRSKTTPGRVEQRLRISKNEPFFARTDTSSPTREQDTGYQVKTREALQYGPVVKIGYRAGGFNHI